MSANSDTSISSGFIISDTWNNEWSDLTLLQERKNCLIYSGVRYDRRFLIKALRPEHRALTEYRQMQQREFRIGIALSHPHISTTYSLEPVDGLGECIVQEYIEGQTLSQWLITKPSWTNRARVAKQLQEAIEYLHARQLIHRDLKGDNILITQNGSNVKLIDFGLSHTDDSIYASKEDLYNEDSAHVADSSLGLFTCTCCKSLFSCSQRAPSGTTRRTVYAGTCKYRFGTTPCGYPSSG